MSVPKSKDQNSILNVAFAGIDLFSGLHSNDTLSA
jgi:hypothetical protein